MTETAAATFVPTRVRRGLRARKADRYVHLDMLRGVAALLVLAGHVRAFVLVGWGDVPAALASPLVKLGYFATSLGHQAVLAFFALSGFLVGGRAFAALREGRFAWPAYLARRLTRLWLVIVPALALTCLLDRIGLSLTGGAGYDGRWFAAFNSGPMPPAGVALDWMTLLGNVAFLQTVAVPVFGSNGPLWSLANEFWYYIALPLAAWALLAKAGLGARLAATAGVAGLVAWLPHAMLAGGIIWAAGAAAAWTAAQPSHRAVWCHGAVRAATLLGLPAALVTAKASGHGFGNLDVGEFIVGLTVAAALPALALMPSPGRLYARVARAASEISFTLYLSHFPLLMLVTVAVTGVDRQVPGFAGAAHCAGLLALSIAWAAALWWCFERHTDHIYTRVRELMAESRRSRRHLELP